MTELKTQRDLLYFGLLSLASAPWTGALGLVLGTSVLTGKYPRLLLNKKASDSFIRESVQAQYNPEPTIFDRIGALYQIGIQKVNNLVEGYKRFGEYFSNRDLNISQQSGLENRV